MQHEAGRDPVDRTKPPQRGSVRALTFCTKGTPYEDEARALGETCERWGVDLTVECIDGRGDWGLNAMLKPGVIQRHFERTGGGFWWLDADARLKGPLPVEPPPCDVGVRLMWPDPGCPEALRHGRWTNSTIWVGRGERVERFLGAWVEACKAVWIHDQKAMEAVIAGMDDLEVWRLPTPLCSVKRFDAEGKAVVWQTQASRRHRKAVRRGPDGMGA